jgi:hypothetical protein
MTQTQASISFPVHVARLPQKGMPLAITATAAEREALASAHGLLGVDFFEAELLVTRWRGDGVRIAGKVRAKATQQCIVTLEPVEARIDTDIDALFVPEHSKLARVAPGGHGEIVVNAAGDDMPETFAGDTIDAGALAEEFFELSLDPYPRKPGAAFAGTVDAAKPESPFAALSALKSKDDSGQ